VEEVELGGLEDEGENLLLGPTNDEYRLFDRDEVRYFFCFSNPFSIYSDHRSFTESILIHDC
jgi:hypothetical protein